MKDLRIVFMGTPEFAVTILKKIIEENNHVVGVITSPDKPAGRGRKLKQSAVKQYALTQNLPILQPKNLKDKGFLIKLKKLNANLQIVVAFRMLPKVVWQMPKYGTFNLHASLLPNYRGAAPINWAIINEETKTGVTTFFIDEKIDTGAIIAKKEVAISKHETAETLHDTLMNLGSNLVIKTIELIQNNQVKLKVQTNTKDLKEAPKLTKENTQINWNSSVKKINAFIRGLNPYPAAWTTLNNEGEKLPIKIYNCTTEVKKHEFSPGKLLISKKEIKITAINGLVNITEIKIPGKRKMDAKSLLNGYTFSKDAKIL
ncbi:MAG: methionyl-tRNA formyltransferase [Flavobacteriales bacterium]